MVSVDSLMLVESARSEGTWVPWMKGVELKIASGRKREYQEHRDEIQRPLLAKIRARELAGDALLLVLAPAMARHLLRDWRGLERDGQSLPYSEAEALALLTNPALPHLREFVLAVAADDASFMANHEAALGN